MRLQLKMTLEIRQKVASLDLRTALKYMYTTSFSQTYTSVHTGKF